MAKERGLNCIASACASRGLRKEGVSGGGGDCLGGALVAGATTRGAEGARNRGTPRGENGLKERGKMKLNRLRGKTTASLLVAVFVISIFTLAMPLAFAGKHGPKGKSNVGHLYLYEKDPSDWSIVDGGAWGKLKYNLEGSEFEFVFNGHGLEPETGYELIYYCDPWPGTGGFLIVGSRTLADASGYVHMEGSMDFGTDLPIAADENEDGAKIWLVRWDQYDEELGKMTHWIPEDILFEHNLITFDDTDD